MEQSDHTTPRVFSLMWMVSHPGSLAKQFIHSTSEIFLIQMVSKSWIDSGAVQTPVPEIFYWYGWCPILAQVFYVDGWCPIMVNLLCWWMVSYPSQSSMLMDGVPSWSWHQKFARGGGDLLVMSIRYISNLVLQEILVMAPEIARGKDGTIICWIVDESKLVPWDVTAPEINIYVYIFNF